MDAMRRELLNVLRDARNLLARPGNNFDWSSWNDADAALHEVDALIAAIGSGRLPDRRAISFLFAPTGPIQEVSLSSGWGDGFLALAERFDQAEVRVYFQATWWQRLFNRRVAGAKRSVPRGGARPGHAALCPGHPTSGELP